MAAPPSPLGANMTLEQKLRELQAIACTVDKAWVDIQIEAMELQFIGGDDG